MECADRLLKPMHESTELWHSSVDKLGGLAIAFLFVEMCGSSFPEAI